MIVLRQIVQYFVEIRALILKICDLRTGTPIKFSDLRYRSEPKNLRICGLKTKVCLPTSDKLEDKGGG
jgi:hypothetical protein